MVSRGGQTGLLQSPVQVSQRVCLHPAVTSMAWQEGQAEKRMRIHTFFFFYFLQQNTSKQPSEIDNIILAVNVSPPHRMKLWAASLCPHIHTNPSYATCPARNGSEPKLLQHLAEVSVIMLSNQDIFLERNVAVEFFQMLCFFKFNHSFSDLGVTAGFRLCTQT